MLLKKGSNNSNVTCLQYGLKIMCCNPGSIDGNFQDTTYDAVKKYQKLKGLPVDGIVGDKTWDKLKVDITHIQQSLSNKGYSLHIDGIAGPTTYKAIKEFQSKHNIISDGIVGPATQAALGYSTNPKIIPEHMPTSRPTKAIVSSALIKFVKSWEGFRANAYKDAGGVKTIGYGSTHGWIMKKAHVTEKEATQALTEDINFMATKIKRDLDLKGISLIQQQFDALCDFAYNLGVSSLFTSTLYKRICAGVRDGTLKENFEDWCKCNGHVNKGLKERRKEEFDIFMRADYARKV